MNTSDRELLELAARVYGAEMNFTDNGTPWFWCEGLEHPWNPLTDDGDALRLAMTLGLVVDTYNMRAISGSRLRAGHNDWVYGDPEEEYDEDTATRRAIVRAAAEIGRSMP